MLADVLTREATRLDDRMVYMKQVTEEGVYTLKPDPRSPRDTRGWRVADEFELKKEELQAELEGQSMRAVPVTLTRWTTSTVEPPVLRRALGWPRCAGTRC